MLAKTKLSKHPATREKVELDGPQHDERVRAISAAKGT